jgi:hypothetical protein
MIRLAYVVTVLLVAFGCGSKSKQQSEIPKPEPLDYSADALWSLAPEGATAGIVLRGGSLVTLSTVGLHIFQAAEAVPRGPEQLLGPLTALGLGAEAFEPDFWSRSGLDMRGGLAAFASATGSLALVLPVRSGLGLVPSRTVATCARLVVL